MDAVNRHIVGPHFGPLDAKSPLFVSCSYDPFYCIMGWGFHTYKSEDLASCGLKLSLITCLYAASI